MYTIIFNLLLTVFGTKAEPIKSFEGCITYNISYPGQKKAISKHVATKYQIFFKKGNIRKEYLNAADSLLFYSIFVFDSNTNYGIKPNSDTMTYYHPSCADLDTSYTKVEKVEGGQNYAILDYPCIQYKVQIRYAEMGADEKPIQYTYFVAPSLHVDRKYVKGDGSNFVYTPSGSIILAYLSYQSFTKYVEATKVKSTDVDEKLFEVHTEGKFLEKI